MENLLKCSVLHFLLYKMGQHTEAYLTDLLEHYMSYCIWCIQSSAECNVIIAAVATSFPSPMVYHLKKLMALWGREDTQPL